MFAFSKMTLARIHKALDALGVLAGVAVLHPGGRLLSVAGDSHRGLSGPTSANPGIATGGFIGESKLEMLDQLRRRSQQFTAEAFLSRDLQSPTGCFVCTGSAVSMKLRCLSF